MPAAVPIDPTLARQLATRAGADRWDVSVQRFAETLGASAARAFATVPPSADELVRYCSSLHLQDLALACACADGHEGAWEQFVRDVRPALYRAADAFDPTGGARDLADTLYADLFGLRERDGERRPLFRYFHGRSSLATWLRAVLAQRHVDRLRQHQRLEPFPAEEGPNAVPAAPDPNPGPDRQRFVDAMRRALAAAVARLAPRDRLRLSCYYAQDLTLAEIGRLFGEHEATASRHLARTRRAIRNDVEYQLAHGDGMSEAEVAECFSSLVEDAGPLDLADVLGSAARKELGADRSS